MDSTPTPWPISSSGLDTFGDVTVQGGGRRLPHPQVTRHAVHEPVLAEELGLHFSGGHHRRALHGQGAALSRFDLRYSAGTLPHEDMVRSIELYGTKVAPVVREEL